MRLIIFRKQRVGTQYQLKAKIKYLLMVKMSEEGFWLVFKLRSQSLTEETVYVSKLLF
jgi:hypothetical protein